MVIPKVNSVGEALQTLSPSHSIGCVDWPEKYPYAPAVSFGIAHTGKEIVLRFAVREQAVRGVTTVANGPVWEDSCVEFFLSLDAAGYYNFEFNCVGAKLLGFRKERDDFEHGAPAVMETIRTFPSLGHGPLELREQQTAWTLDAVIPAAALFRHRIADLSGLEARANFYKCGDALPQPHFLSWAPIDWPEPNFHLEQFFAGVTFEK